MKKVSLSEIVSNLDFQSEDTTAYCDPQGGKIVFRASDGEIFGLDEGEEGSGAVEGGDDEDDEWDDEDDEDEDGGDDEDPRLEGMIALPSSYEIDEYSIMKNFANDLEAEAMSAELSRAIQGTGAFRRFKDTVRRLGIEERWYAYKADALKEIAVAWCEENGIAYVDDIARKDPSPEVTAKVQFYERLEAEAAALVEGEPDAIANAANLAALLFQRLEHINWAGFYFVKGDTLVVGPFQGKPACVRIALGKGVCGTAAAKKESILVPDVHQFAGHIACDAASNSEVVVPLLRGGELLGVLDLDSPLKARFDQHDQSGLERIAAIWVAAGG